MSTTIFLAQIWGPILLALGIGFFTSRKYYTKIYRDLEKQSFAVFLFSVFAITVGIIQVGLHNVWGSFTEIVISILGWGTLVKGIIFAVAPRAIDRTADWEADSNLILVAGVFMLVLGLYLSFVGYIA